MTRVTNDQIDELYRLPLDQFTQARNTLAKSQSGTQKKQIASLGKPSLPMWVVNQLFWQDAPTYKALIDASEKLRAAHRAALSGRKADTRTADQLHRTTVEKAFAKAIGLADKRGVKITEPVRDTVRRTLAALPGDEAPGRLTRAPEPAGFSLLTGVKVKPAAPKPRSGEGGSDARAARERQEAERKAREERKAQEKREREIRKAEQALKNAERRLAELKG
jgi:hypothetical protein